MNITIDEHRMSSFRRVDSCTTFLTIILTVQIITIYFIAEISRLLHTLFHVWILLETFLFVIPFFLSRKSQLLPFARKVLGFGKMLRQHKTKAFVMVRIMPNWNKNSSRALQAHYRKINLPELYQKKNLANNHQGYKNKNHSYHNHLQFYSYSFSYSI